jgi:hypothetical protein
MLYSAQISTYYDFKKRVFQLYYYTGDPSMIWQNATVESAVVINSQASIVNKFLAIDAGDHDAESMLASGDFNFAVLGLLARNIENPTLYARKLVALARVQFTGLDRFHKLVHCVTIAFLRGRAELIWQEVTTVEKNNIIRDPFWPIFLDKIDNNQKKLHLEIFRSFEELKNRFGAALPTDALDRAIYEFDWADLETLQSNMATASTLRDAFSGTSLTKKTKTPQNESAKAYGVN